jgi:hypothetical protein
MATPRPASTFASFRAPVAEPVALPLPVHAAAMGAILRASATVLVEHSDGVDQLARRAVGKRKKSIGRVFLNFAIYAANFRGAPKLERAMGIEPTS